MRPGGRRQTYESAECIIERFGYLGAAAIVVIVIAIAVLGLYLLSRFSEQSKCSSCKYKRTKSDGNMVQCSQYEKRSLWVLKSLPCPKDDDMVK